MNKTPLAFQILSLSLSDSTSSFLSLSLSLSPSLPIFLFSSFDWCWHSLKHKSFIKKKCQFFSRLSQRRMKNYENKKRGTNALWNVINLLFFFIVFLCRILWFHHQSYEHHWLVSESNEPLETWFLLKKVFSFFLEHFFPKCLLPREKDLISLNNEHFLLFSTQISQMTLPRNGKLFSQGRHVQ